MTPQPQNLFICSNFFYYPPHIQLPIHSASLDACILAPKWHHSIMAKVSSKTRLTMRVPKRLHATLNDAAQVSGATVNQFILQSALKEAHRLLESASVIRLSTAQTRKMLELLDHPPKPNKHLRAALKDFKKNVRA